MRDLTHSQADLDSASGRLHGRRKFARRALYGLFTGYSLNNLVTVLLASLINLSGLLGLIASEPIPRHASFLFWNQSDR